ERLAVGVGDHRGLRDGDLVRVRDLRGLVHEHEETDADQHEEEETAECPLHEPPETTPLPWLLRAGSVTRPGARSAQGFTGRMTRRSVCHRPSSIGAGLSRRVAAGAVVVLWTVLQSLADHPAGRARARGL